MNNTKEVGFTPDDNNDRRLPGSVQPEPQRGDSAYHHPNMIRYHGSMDTADTAGVVGQPTFDYSGMGQEGYMHPNQNSNVDMKNSDTSLMAPVGDSETNLSKKYKYPQVHQDIPAKGQPSTQYSDHT